MRYASITLHKPSNMHWQVDHWCKHMHIFCYEKDKRSGGCPGKAHPASSKKNAQKIPTLQYDAIDTYERDYTRTFAQSTSYIRARGARAEIGEFVEYNLDNEDEDWLEDYNNERKNLNPEKAIRFYHFLSRQEFGATLDGFHHFLNGKVDDASCH